MKHQRGFIALMSAIIISFLLIAITATLGFSGFFQSTNMVDAASKEQSYFLARGCINAAILQIIHDKNYQLQPPDHDINIGKGSCDIVSMLSGTIPRSFPITIRATAIVDKAHTNLEAVLGSDFGIISITELPSFQP